MTPTHPRGPLGTPKTICVSPNAMCVSPNANKGHAPPLSPQSSSTGIIPANFPFTNRSHHKLSPASSCPSPSSDLHVSTADPIYNERAVDCIVNERAVDCPVDNAFLRKSLSLDYEHRKKLSPPGCDVIRRVDRSNSPEVPQSISPVLMAPYRRKTKKGKDKDKCNTQ